MITCAVMVPHPPLLVPELVPGAVERTAVVREATLTAARTLAQVSPMWLAVGTDVHRATIGPDNRGTFQSFGVDVPVTLAEGRAATAETGSAEPTDPARTRELPLAALVAGWLRARAGARSVRVELVGEHTPTAECAALGQRLADSGRAGSEDVGLLVLGDGSTRHPSAPPGWADERAGPFDDRVRGALADADCAALLSLDAALAAELQAQGRAAWQVLAGFGHARPGWRGELLYSQAPFGVAYHVAVWRRT